MYVKLLTDLLSLSFPVPHGTVKFMQIYLPKGSAPEEQTFLCTWEHVQATPECLLCAF